ncbi:S-layer homology domain-containing protein [Oscillibacter sp. MSJ-31]|uniref:S-layer homology domain-containing protein n=1 Tax=Oscillibacter sp. MSJ-31 TaxID=2841526 RepID=UPI001C0F5D64|nr:S-layer homology domain-containing protein [Oscillibacter sp. MSJ-31]MBU5458744.1 S-layer homology domain-containing protein [Oscillibacter sp. MSJ-31]
MKKLLALVLALVMTMSLVTISNAAFKDADKISNKEAVDVMAAVGVLAGYDNGEFGAKDELTRGQAAKIIAYLDLGGKTADAIKGSGTVFTDVKATSWYAGYVEYCAGAGYVAGVGGGKFDPDAKVTGVQFAKMLLCALGYKSDVEGYTGADYTISVARDANKNDLFDALSIVTSANLTREQAAQMAFNALKATVVEYQGGTNVSTSDGTKVTVNATRNNVALDASKDYRDADQDGYQQLCEKLYGGSKGLKRIKNSVANDDFGRPADYKWTYDGKDVYTAYKAATFTYTADTSAKDMLKDLKGYKLSNGTKITTEAQISSIAALTDNGKLVEVYFNSDNKLDTNVSADGVVEVTYTLAKVTSVKTNKDGDVTYKFDNVSGTFVDYADDDLKDDTVKLAGTVAKNDYVTVYKTAGNVAYVYPTTKVVGTQSAYNTQKSTLTIGATTYKYGTGVAQTAAFNGTNYPNTDKDANYFLDQFGFVVKATEVESELKFAAIDVIGNVANSLETQTKAKLVFTDGTVKEIVVAKLVDGNSTITLSSLGNGGSNSTYDGRVASYKIDDDGEYELTLAASNKADVTSYSKGTPTIGGKTTGSNTIFVVKTPDGNSSKYTVYTGFKAMPSISTTSSAKAVVSWGIDDGDVTFVYVDATASNVTVDDTSDNASIVYITSAKYTTSGKSGKEVYSYAAVIDGEAGTLKTKTTVYENGNDTLVVGLYKVKAVNSDGAATRLEKLGGGAYKSTDFVKYDTSANGFAYGEAKNGVLQLSATDTYTYDGSETVYVIDADGNVADGTADSINAKDGDIKAIYVKVTDSGKIALKTVYVIEK